MGLDKASIRVLLAARQAGVSFERVLTIGRQELLYINQNELRLLLSRNGFNASRETVQKIFTDESGYCEPLLRFIGAHSIDSLDISAFEGASILHDMNRPLPEEFFEKFTFLFDGGSLEHIFHFPTALSNCMRAVSVGGHFITITPVNNLMGHGFYQFSPELFFRALTRTNGFEIVRILLYEYPWRSGPWYEVSDPEQIRSRVILKNRRPVYLIAWGKKIASVPVFAQPPQQSDYATAWRRSAGEADHPSSESHYHRPFYKQYAPQWLRKVYLTIWPFGSSCYKRVRY
jgi:hypothetical protein